MTSENHEIAEFMRQLGKRGFGFDEPAIAAAIGANGASDAECWARLADLVDGPILRAGTVIKQTYNDVMLCTKEVEE